MQSIQNKRLIQRIILRLHLTVSNDLKLHKNMNSGVCHSGVGHMVGKGMLEASKSIKIDKNLIITFAKQ